MKGLCVEVTKGEFAHRRGIVRTKLNQLLLVDIKDLAPLRISLKDVCAVYTIGIPRESRVKVESAALTNDVVQTALRDVDSSKFYLAYVGGDGVWQHFVKFRTVFVERMLEIAVQQDKEPLLRVYIGSFSQDDPGAKIIFSDSMQTVDENPAHVDFDSEWVVECSTLSSVADGSSMREFNVCNLMTLL
tara:strand:- start:318 stop:881 length:564 start_codon:yes stop_codon:yes gene_type:complete